MEKKTAEQMVEEADPFFFGDMALLMEKYAAQEKQPLIERIAELEAIIKLFNQPKTPNI